MKKTAKPAILGKYQNGGFQVTLYEDGTKVRQQQDPARPPEMPEQMDFKLTQWCDAGCAWCHEKSTPQGTHADVTRSLELLQTMPAGSEIAIGGGDPLSHPEFEQFVRGLRSFGMVPSVTVNGRHFERSRDMLEKLTREKQLFGVGISYHDAIPDWDYEHMVLHLIAGVNHPSVLDSAKRRMKVLILGYKQFGRGKKLFELRPQPVQDNIAAWYRQLFIVGREHHLSFDNLAIDQLKPSRMFANPKDYEKQYMGPEGQFSMYVDGVEETFALSSYSAARTGWSNMRDMFTQVRQSQGFAIAGAI